MKVRRKTASREVEAPYFSSRQLTYMGGCSTQRRAIKVVPGTSFPSFIVCTVYMTTLVYTVVLRGSPYV